MKNLKLGVMKTAIDWLIEQLENHNGVTKAGFENVIKQAKLLEKEQLRTMHLVTWMNKDLDFEKYYEEYYEDQRSNTNN
jgi:hypothetical protein